MMNINNIKKYFKEKISLSRIKLTAIIVSILLLGTFALPVFGGIASAQNYPVLSGTTYLNMPEKTFGGKTTTCKLTITNFNLNKNEFTLKGILSYSNRNYPLSIQGMLYKSRIGKDNFVALAKDTTNKFNVLHFSILFHPDKHFLVTKKIRNLVSKQPVSKTNNPFPIITIYLQRKNTREISFVEGREDLLLSNISLHFSDISKNSNNYCYGPVTTETYMYLIFKPVLAKTVQSTSTYDNDTAEFYRSFYNYAANQYTIYEIYIFGGTLIEGNNAAFQTKLKILSATTTIKDASTWRTINQWDGTPYTLGSYSNPVTSKMVTTYGSALTEVDWHGTYHTKPRVRLQFDVGLHLDILFVNLGITASTNISYESEKGEYFHPGANELPWPIDKNPDSSDWTRAVSVPFFNTCLKADANAITQLYQLNYWIYLTDQNNVHAQVRWTVPVFYYQFPGQFYYDQTITLNNNI